jgi:hypothetical protein
VLSDPCNDRIPLFVLQLHQPFRELVMITVLPSTERFQRG